MTERLYYNDCYLQSFRARVVDRSADGHVLYLDRTAFYPTSGGQPFDTGLIAGKRVLEVIDEDSRIAHRVETAVKDEEVECSIDWARRFDHTQQHTGQHLLSAVFIEVAGIHTVSFHLGQEISTIDLETESLSSETLRAVELRANQVICENRPVTLSFHKDDEAAHLRVRSERQGLLRVVSIEGLDRIACGGTHVRLTGEIGPILIRGLEKVRKTMRVEFLCGSRAVRRARADFDALSRVAQAFSSSVDDAPGMVSGLTQQSREADKLRRHLQQELAQYRGRELYASAEPDQSGVRKFIHRHTAGSLEELRPLAQSFTAQPKTVFLAVIEQPPSVLLASSTDSGIDAGNVLKTALQELGGRGGGTSRMAQGSVPSPSLLPLLLERLELV
jgi:alanyl-tRNA synthetase